MRISRFADPTGTVYRFLIALLIYMIGGFPTLVYALPQGGTIASGAGTIDTSGSALTVTQTTNKIIINWESFSIGNNESVIFLQPDSSSSALNNVLGTSRTVVEGNLLANGQIVLSNPNGIFLSPNANIDVAGLIASTLKISEQDFLDGLYKFSQDSSKPLASILNEGKIRASDFAALIAPSVDNKGVVIANLGTVGLVSGKAATVDFVGDNLIKFTVNAPVEGQVLDKNGNLISDRISNSGSIQANGGQVILSAKNASSIIQDVINVEGLITAKTVTKKNGLIVISGGNQGNVNVAGTLDASGEKPGDQGGEITIEGATVTTYNASIQAEGTDAKGGDINITGTNWVSATGTIDVSGETGGNVNITTGDLDISAPILAKGTTGQGGNININTLFMSWEVVSAMLDVSGASGGSIKHFADQQIVTSGKYLAIGTDGKGGSIDVTANALKFMSNTIDASGTMGGGRIRLGGEYQGGKNLTIDEIKNAQTLVMTDTANITAKTMGTDGDGGRIIAWADQGGVVLGQFDTTPGTQTGAGGFVEVSSGDVLNFRGNVRTGIGDRLGTLLLDPKNITISTAEVYSQSSLLMGFGYTGHSDSSIDDFDETTLDSTDDLYGFSVSLDGNRLAVGTPFGSLLEESSGSDYYRNGAVFLYSFDDSSFSNATLQNIVGRGRSINHYNNRADQFGTSVSLDTASDGSARLAVGARNSDGMQTNTSLHSSGNRGTVYLFSFTGISANNNSFAGGELKAIIGEGFTTSRVQDTGNAKFFDRDGFFVGKDASPPNGLDISSHIGTDDNFGQGVSLDGTMLAVGAQGDDVSGTSGEGAAYLFNFASGSTSATSFESPTLVGKIGDGYSIANTSLSAGMDETALEASDAFGHELSLDAIYNSSGVVTSARLAVVAKSDDGSGNGNADSGAVYLYTFSDSSFSNATKVGTIGDGYSGATLTVASSTDALTAGRTITGGTSGATGVVVTGAANSTTVTYTVTSGTFVKDERITEATSNYTRDVLANSKDIDITIDEDNVVSSVSLDGTNLAFGIADGDGSGNAENVSGEVYNFSFTDNAFLDGVLEGRMGYGYSKDNSPANYDAAKNRDQEPSHALIITEFEPEALTYTEFADQGGGTTLVTASANHTLSTGDTVTISGTTNYNGTFVITKSTSKKFIISEAFVADDATGSSSFTKITVEQLGVGNNLGHGKIASGQVVISGTTNYDGTYTIATIDGSDALWINKAFVADDATGIARASSIQSQDRFGQGVSIDNGRLVVGAAQGNNFSGNKVQSGEVYLFPVYADDGTDNARLFSTNPSADHTISPSTLATLLSNPTDVTLQASNDIGIFEEVDVANASGDGGHLTLQAGRSILINANITTDNGNLTLTANDTTDNGVVDAQRDSGNAAITMTTGAEINVGTGTLTATISDDTSKTNSATGDIQLFSVTAATMNVTNSGATDDSNIIDDNNNDEAFTVSGVSTFTATGDGDITLNNTSGHAFSGAVRLNTGTGNAVVVDTSGLDLGLSTVGGTLSATAVLGDIVDSGTLTITGVATFTTKADDSDIILDSTDNTFAAAVKMVADDGSEDFENITFVDSAAVDFDASVSANGDLWIDAGTDHQVTGNLIVTAGGNITQNVALAVTGTSSFTTNNTDGTITLSGTNALAGTVSLNTEGSSGNATLDNGTTALDLATSTVGGNLAVTAGNDITDCNGCILTVGGTSSFAADVNDKTINLSENHAFTEAISFTTTDNETGTANDADVSVTGISGTALKLGASTVKGDLTITTSNAGGATNTAISDEGVLTIHGNSTFTSTATDAAIDLDSANLFTGWVKLATATGGDATITTGGQALEFNTSTVGRHLSVTSSAAITQSGVLTVTGTTTITADNSGTKQDVSLEDLTTGGTPDAQNQFSGAVSVTGNWVKLGTANGVILGDITTADASGHFTLDPNQSGGNTGSVTQAAGTALDIYQKTIITATGIDVLLTSATNDMTRVAGAQIRVDGTNVEIVDIDNIELGTITATGFLNVTAGGAVTNSSSTGALTITGATTIQAKSGSTYYDVTLDHTSSDFATIKVTGANVILVDANAIVLGASTVTGTYAVTATAGGDITQATDEALRITGAATFNAAGGQSIILGNSNTFDDTSNAGATDANVTFAAVSGNLKNVTIKDSDEFELRVLELVKVDSAGGELTVTTGGALTDGGALVIPGTTTITATGQSVVLDTTSNDFATILFGSSGNAVLSVEVEDTNAIVIGTSHSTGDFKVTAGGNITDDGTITVAASDATLYAITDANNGDITLNQLAVAGFIDLATNDAANNDTGHATIVNTTDVKLAASTVEGDLSATATTGNITQTGALTIKGTSTLVTSAEDADITLTETSNAFAGALLITTNDNTDGADNIYTADVEIDNGSTALVMGLSTIDGDLSLLSGGTLTDTGIATVRGNLTATTDASSSAITLNQLAVDGSFTLAPNSSGAVIIVNDAGLDLALSTMGGTFNGTATTGNITQSGTLTITGAATFITGVDGSNIILDASGNAFSAAVKMKADGGGTEDFGNITFVDSAGINFATSAGSNGDLYIDSSADGKVGGSLIVTATTGNITNAAALQVATTSSFTTSADDATITLSAPAVALTGAVTLSTSGSSGHATIDNGTTILKIAESTVGGNLTLTSGASTSGSDYAIMDTGTLTVSGNLIATTDDNNGVIDLGSLAVNGSFDLTTDGSGNATVINATGLEFIASGIGGNLSATATTGNITQKTGALTVGGTTTLVTTAQGANIDLLSTITSNAFTGELLITTNDNDSPADSTYEAHVKIDGGTTNLIIGTSTIDGDLTLLSGGTITDTNSSTVTIKGDLSATTDANSSDITLNDLAVSGQIQLDTVIVSNEDTAQAGSTGTTIKLATGASTTDDFYNSMSIYISSGVGAGQVRDISDYVGSTRVATVATWTTTPDATSVYEVRSSFGDATVVNATDIKFAASTVGGNLTATATIGDVTQSGALNIAGISTITASDSGADVILFNPLNDFVGAVSTTGHDVKLWDTNAIDLGAATVAGVYTVYAGTTIEDSGAQVVTGLSYIYTHDDASQITLDHASNSFGRTVDYQGGIGFTVVDSDATGFILVGRTLLGNLHVTAAGPVTQNGTQIIGGTTTIIATGQNVTLTDVSNDFKNAVIIKGEDVEVVDGVATTIGGNSIGIDLGASTVSGTYKVTATAGNIIDSGNLVIEEIATVLASTSSDQDITLNSNNNFKSGIRLEGRNVVVRVASAASLILGASSGTSTITGWLKGTGVGNAVTDGGALSVAGTTNLLATGQDVTLDSEANGTAHTNNFQGLLKIKGANVSVTHPTYLKLGVSTISGTYDIRTTTGNITDGSGETLTVGSTSSFTTDADGADIKLDTTTNKFTGAVTVNTVGTGGDAEIHGGSTPLKISASGGVGTLKLTTTGTGGNITDEDALVVAGATTINAGGADVTLDDGSSNLTGAVGASGKVVKLTHNRSTGIKLGDSTVTETYTVTATTGDITDTGNLTITGLTTLVTSADGADIILDGTGHTFTGNVKVTTNETSTNADAHATIDGGSSVGLKIEKGSEVQGDLTLRSGHANTITDEGDSGVVTVDGNLTATTYANNGSITLNDLAVDGTIGLNTHGTGDATVVNDVGLNFAASTVGGDLHATATTGDITQSGALDIDLTTTLITVANNASITLGTASNAFTGALIITTNDNDAAPNNTNGDVTIHGGTTALILGTSTIDGDLTLTSTATGDAGITNNGTLNIRGTTTVSASGVDVTLNSAANNFQGAVAIDGVNVTVVDADNIMLAASTVTGNYTLTAGGLVEDDNSGALAITGVTTIDAGGNVVLDIATNNFQSAVKIVGVNVTVVDAGAIELGTSTVTGTYAVTATAGGDITNIGVLTITGAATFKAASSQSIYLNESNTFSSTVAFTTPSGNLANVTVRDTTNFDLVALTLSGDLVVTSTGGSITDDGVLAISGTSSFTTSANNKFITLDVTTNAFTRAVTLNTTGSLGHAEIDGGTTQLIIAASTVGGDLKLTSGNATGITDSGTVTVNGNLIVINDVSNGDINMGSLAVDGTIALVTTGSGGDVTVVNDAGLDFVSSSIGGDLTATATSGNISDSGTLTVTGATNIYLGTNPILSVSGATSATDINGNTITLNISVFTGGITLHYDNVLPPDDNSDIYLASQVAFAELLFSIDQNITKTYGSYEETQDHLLWMYKLFRDSFPMQEQFLEVDRQPQPNQVKLRKIKTNIKKNNASEGKRL